MRLMLAVLLLLGTLGAQTGQYGRACGGLLLNHVGTPKLGGSVETWLNANLWGAPGLHLVGTRQAPVQYAPGCFVHVAPVVVLPFHKGKGVFIVRWRIPNNPRLLGVRVDEQFLLFDWVCGCRWFSSNGGWWVVG